MPGRKLKNPLEAQLQVRLPRKLLADLRQLAAGEHRSLNGQIVYALELHLWQVECRKRMDAAFARREKLADGGERFELPDHPPPPQPPGID